MVTLTKQSNNSQGQRPMPARGGARRGSMKDAIKNNTISKGTVKRLLAYFKPHLFKLVIVIIAIILTAASLTLIGDGLRDALDPKMRN